MKKLILFLLCFFLCSSAFGGSYIVDDFYDADKTFVDDSHMCWSASLSNILAYTGWDAGYNNEDAIFDEFKDYFKVKRELHPL